MLLVCALSTLGTLLVAPDWTPREPEVLPEVENYFRDAHARMMRERPEPEDETEALHGFIEEFEDEVRVLFEREHAYTSGLFLHAGIGSDGDGGWLFQQIVGMIVNGLPESAHEACEFVAPYWPPEHERLWQVIGGLLGSIAASDDPERFRTDFSVMMDVLSSAWENDSHAYDGLVDFMFERNAIMAWLAMLEMEGVNQEERDELFDELVAASRPYGVYYRDKPDALPDSAQARFAGLLDRFANDDSLWARVFVAEILNKVPYMRDPEIEAALREEPHWLIQRRMAYLDEEGATGED